MSPEDEQTQWSFQRLRSEFRQTPDLLKSHWRLGTIGKYEFCLKVVMPPVLVFFTVWGAFISVFGATLLASFNGLAFGIIYYWLLMKHHSLKQTEVSCVCYPDPEQRERNCSLIHTVLVDKYLLKNNLRGVDQQDVYNFALGNNEDVRFVYLEVVKMFSKCASHSIQMTLPRSPYHQICTDEWPTFMAAMQRVRCSSAPDVMKIIILDEGALEQLIDAFAWDFACNEGCLKMKEYLSCHYHPVHLEVSYEVKDKFSGVTQEVDLWWRSPMAGEAPNEFLRIENEVDILLSRNGSNNPDIYDRVGLRFSSSKTHLEKGDCQRIGGFFNDKVVHKDSSVWERVGCFTAVKQRCKDSVKVKDYRFAKEKMAEYKSNDSMGFDEEVKGLLKENESSWKKVLREMVATW